MALTDSKVQRAIKALRTFEPEDEPYYLCYSGGKGMLSDFQTYPRYKRAYISAFDRMLKTLDHSIYRDGYEVFNWRVQLPNYFPGQMSFDNLP